MTARSDVIYFGAGPAPLPTEVLESAAQALVNFENTGLGLAEHSHRSTLASKIINAAKADLANYLDVPDNYEILFMQAGGTGEFSATVYNLVAIWVAQRKRKIIEELSQYQGLEIVEDLVLERLQEAVSKELKLDYLVTGSWSLKASQEAARLLGSQYVNVVTDSRKINKGCFGKIPDQSSWCLSKNPAMIYYCDNETVDGVEFPSFPNCLEPSGERNDDPIVVADMSSNILSRRIPIKNFSVIFFGAQKNLGITGITVVIIKKSLLPPHVMTPEPIVLHKLGLPVCPAIFSYELMSKNNSLYNTLSIFDVYVAGQVIKRLLMLHPNKIHGQEAVSDEKAKLIYTALDAYPDIYQVVPDKSVRSRMNICFRVIKTDSRNEISENLFLDCATKLGLQGLKGHRSVGGIRASNYNTITLDDTRKLVAFIKDFASSAR